jgi:hypothetical protein
VLLWWVGVVVWWLYRVCLKRKELSHGSSEKRRYVSVGEVDRGE